MPRRIEAPAEPLHDDAVRLEPVTAADGDDLDAMARDADVLRFTGVPLDPPPGFGATWAQRYVDGWRDGGRAGFTIRDARSGEFLGAAMFVSVDLDAREGEAGYVLGPRARGRGAASRALALLTSWAFDELGLERVELRIDSTNAASERVAERCGYTREGVLRSVHFKGDRVDVAVWSRLRTDPPVPSRP